MPKQKTEEQQRTITTCICGMQGQKEFSATLKDNSRQLYCCEECREEDLERQKQGQQRRM